MEADRKRERMKEKIEMESKREERNLVIAVAASIEK